MNERMVCQGREGMVHLRELTPLSMRGSHSRIDSIHRQRGECGHNHNSCPTEGGSGEEVEQ